MSRRRMTYLVQMQGFPAQIVTVRGSFISAVRAVYPKKFFRVGSKPFYGSYPVQVIDYAGTGGKYAIYFVGRRY